MCLQLFYVDSEGCLKNICDDVGTIALVDQLRTEHTIDIYVESPNIMQGGRLPNVIMACVKRAMDLFDVVKLDAKVNEGMQEMDAM